MLRRSGVLHKPVVNSCIVMAAYAEGALCQYAAILNLGLCALVVENVKQNRIFCLAGHNDNIIEVLGSGTNKRCHLYQFSQ